MRIEVHGFHGRFARLDEAQLDDLITALDLPDRPQPEQLKNGKYVVQYAFSGSGRSFYVWLGQRHDLSYLRLPAQYEDVRLELHGSFFDSSPDFDLATFLKVIDQIGTFRPTQLDIAFCDDTGKTDIADWQRVMTNPQYHCVGNLFKPFPHTEIVKSLGKFSRIHLGKANSKTCYGTIYKRPEGEIRLELKFRDRDYIRSYLDDIRRGNKGIAVAVSLLQEQIDILTLESKETKNPKKYEREPFYADFLNSRSRRDAKEKTKRRKSEARSASAAGTFKYLAARLQGGLPRLEAAMGLDELSERLTEMTGYLITISRPELDFT